MKRLLALLMCITTLSGCATTSTKQTIKIGVTVYDSYDTFVTELMDEFNSTVASMGDVTVEVYDAQKSQTTQNKQIESLLESGCDVICVNLVDRTSPKKIIDLARQYDVPVIFFNRELVEEDLESWEKLYYVGADASESGVMEGEIAADACLEEGADKNDDGMIQYIVLEGENGHQDAIVRTEKSVDTLIENGIEVDKLGGATANWNREQAQTKMTQFYNEFEDSIELVICNNDDMALGAIDAYESLGIELEDRPIIVGIDGTDAGLEAVKNGTMAGTVYNDKVGQAKAMAKLAYALVTDGSLDDLDLIDGKYIRLPYSKVTISNIDAYLN